MGFGLKFRAIALDPNFRKLQPELIASVYRNSQSRIILLDYDGTMINQVISKTIKKHQKTFKKHSKALKMHLFVHSLDSTGSF
jgi:hypothetical protein